MPAYVSRTRRPASRSRAFAALPGALLVAALGGCGQPSDTKFAPACPSLSRLHDGNELTRFRPGGQDVSSLVLRALIGDVPARCEEAGAGQVRATVSIAAQMQRGPAAVDSTQTAQYFIAVTDGDKVLEERDFTLSASFPANVTQLAVNGDDIELMLPVSKQKSAAAYHIYVGFRLTPEQLAYNRAHPAP